MKTPTRALVLAAGQGTRLRPLTLDVPKPLLPVWGTPAIVRILDLLAGWGVRDVLVNLHQGAGLMFERLRLRAGTGRPRIQLSYEPEMLGTGGALVRAAWFCGEEPFWIVNADIAVDLEPDALVRAYADGRPLAALWMHETLGPRTVEVVEGRVRTFHAARPGTPGTFTFCGVHLVSPAVLRFLPARGPAHIVDAYERALRRGRSVLGVCVRRAFWADIGDPSAYLAAHRRIHDAYRAGADGARLFSPDVGQRAARMRRGGVGVRGVVAPGTGVTAGRGARIADSVLLDGAAIAADARVENAIVGPGARAAGAVKGLVVRGDACGDEALVRAIRALGWSPARTVVSPLAERGSDRTFTRVARGRARAVVMQYGTRRAENTLYASHARFLARARVRVPAVLRDLPTYRTVVIEDVGDRSLLEAAAGRSEDSVLRLYRRVLAVMVRLHRDAGRLARQRRIRLCEPFSLAVCRWEHDLFAEYFLKRRLTLAPAAIAGIRAELAKVARRLMAEPRVLMHRDLQSSNILLRNGEPVLLDFQGMRFGPAVYDLAALICDPYVSLSPRVQSALLDAYAPCAGRSPAGLREAFWPAAVERLVQALGAFGRLAGDRRTRRFEGYIRPALNMMDRALSNLYGLERLKRLVGSRSAGPARSGSRKETGHG